MSRKGFDWQNKYHRDVASLRTLKKMLEQAEREKRLVYIEYCERSLEIERAISHIEERLGR